MVEKFPVILKSDRLLQVLAVFIFVLFPFSGHKLIQIGNTVSVSLYVVLVVGGSFVTFFLLLLKIREKGSFFISWGTFLYLVFFLLLSMVVMLQSLFVGGLRVPFAHLLLLVFLINLSICMNCIDMQKVYRACFCGLMVMIFVDGMAFISLDPVVEASDWLGVGYSGIGFNITFANHGAGSVFGIISGLVLLVGEKKSSYIKKIIILSLIFLSGVMIVLSQSRSSILAVSLSVVTFLCLYIYSSWRASPRIKILAGLIVFASVVALLVFFTLYLIEQRSSTVILRMSSYIDALDIISKNPWGIGWGEWHRLYDTQIRMHNMIINYALASGLLGLFSIASVIGLVLGVGIKGLVTISRENRFKRIFLFGAFSIFIGSMVEAMAAPQTPSEWMWVASLLMTFSANDSSRNYSSSYKSL